MPHAMPSARLLAAALWLAAGTAAAQPPQDDAFPRAYFAGTSVANAYDMLLRVPGFSIVEPDEDVRGYAAALGNVLVDGARPSSKREKLDDLLKRIPAGSVERIELLRTGAPGMDMGGFAVLANVVRVHAASSEAAVEAGLAGGTDGWKSVPLEIEYGRRNGEHAFDFALKREPELDDDTGRGRIRTHAPDGTSVDDARLDTRTTKDKGEAAASWRQPLAGGRLTLTSAYRTERERVGTHTWPRDDDDGERVDEREDTREAEGGARYVRPVGAHTTLELLATDRIGRLDHRERSREDGDDETFDERTRTGEAIGRAELTHEHGERLSFNASFEVARNTLESDARLVQDGAPVPLPGSDVRIAELRREAAVGATWKASDALALEAGFRFEWSAIAQRGDTPLQRRFAYPKPRVALRWDAGARDQLRLSLSREVGQLDFEDFVASASLDTGTVSAGNAELAPDRTWRLATAWEHRFDGDAALTLGWTHDRIEDVVDRVLVVSGDDVFDAPGNIGDGRRDTLSLDLSTPLDGLGIAGGRLRATLLYRDSRVVDPVTGTARRISEEKPVEGEVEFAQDLPAWRANWGLKLEHIAERETKYRYDEIERKSEGTGWTLYAERRLGERWRVRAETTDLFGRRFERIRDKYDGPRSVDPLEERETRRRTAPGTFTLTFRRSFGG